MAQKANDLRGFSFEKVSSGAYMVTYSTPNRGDYWRARIEDMLTIDRTHGAEWAKIEDIKHLRKLVKLHGSHYNIYGQLIPTRV